MGIALSHDFDGKVLDPYGAGIALPCWICKRLKKLHLPEHNHPTGMMRIKVHVSGWMPLRDGPDFRPERSRRAFDSGVRVHAQKTAPAIGWMRIVEIEIDLQNSSCEGIARALYWAKVR
jgi:hypothetical protein